MELFNPSAVNPSAVLCRRKAQHQGSRSASPVVIKRENFSVVKNAPPTLMTVEDFQANSSDEAPFQQETKKYELIIIDD